MNVCAKYVALERRKYTQWPLQVTSCLQIRISRETYEVLWCQKLMHISMPAYDELRFYIKYNNTNGTSELWVSLNIFNFTVEGEQHLLHIFQLLCSRSRLPAHSRESPSTKSLHIQSHNSERYQEWKLKLYGLAKQNWYLVSKKFRSSPACVDM